MAEAILAFSVRSPRSLATRIACIQKHHEREGLLAHFPDVQVRNSIALDLAMIDQYDALLPKLERHIRTCGKEHDRKAFTLLRSIHGADLILPLVILYEICTIERFARVQDFLSYCRLVKPGRESNGKLLGHAGGKIGNAHLKWIFGELATTFLRGNAPAQALHERLKNSTARASPWPSWPPSSPARCTSCSSEDRSSTRTSSTRIDSQPPVGARRLTGAI